MPPEFVVFLDENHCGTPQLLAALASAGVKVERHSDHFARGTPDTEWLPFVGQRGWSLLTTDKKIRYRYLERLAVQTYSVRMFCFTRNGSAEAMGAALFRALPRMAALTREQAPPFIATVSITGEVNLREDFASAEVG